MMLLEDHKKKFKIGFLQSKNKHSLNRKSFLYNWMKEEFKQEVQIIFHLIKRMSLDKESFGNLH